MCGRTAQGLAPGQIRQQLENTLPSKPADTWIGEDKYRISHNVPPTRYQPVVRADSATRSYVVHMMRWGLIPRHTQSMPEYSSVLKSINARDDSLFMGPSGKAMFNHSKNHKRCILLAEGFFEWRRRGKERVPFYTRRRDGNMMLMAAIYDVAKIKEEPEPMYTYATITTNASPQLDWLHDRMPVLIPNNDHDKIRAWLDPNLKWNSTLEAMLKPCDEFMEPSSEGGNEPVYALETYQVDEKVNSVRNDSPDLVKPWNSSSNKKTLNRFFFAKPEPTSSEPSQSAPTSSTSTPLKKDGHLESKDGVGDFDEPFDYADDMAVVGDSEDNSVKDEEEFEQEQVSVGADASKRDEGFEELQEQRQQGRTVLSSSSQDNDDPEDRDLALALKLSRQAQYNYQPAASPSNRTASIPDSPSSPSTRMNRAAVDSPTRSVSRKMQAISSSLTGSVDLLEKRRQQRKQEEDEMEQVLELSRLQAIGDGHEDVDGENNSQDSTTRSTASEAPPFNNEEHTQDDLERREAEELEKAIAASLNDSANATSPTSSPSFSTYASPSHPKKPAQPQSPTASPLKRKSATQSSPSSPAGSSPMKPAKKGKPSQDVKITSFFQHTSPS
ncbi:hypothetical protein KI688_004892 [Linnemannia hyalina]|uniref:DUF159-domain-containing protein n=1 Tax=Linnemannia hyalina TaxID=64524 RepID=A0A9P8BNT3_9FUNG|nr:hypothetical protein KI688_004892 [Linnemannia hyalina]